jgi:hypothetical protein
VLAGNRKRLDFSDRICPGGRITRVPDGACAWQSFYRFLVKSFGNQSHGAHLVKAISIGRNDSAGFLPAMLERE